MIEFTHEYRIIEELGGLADGFAPGLAIEYAEMIERRVGMSPGKLKVERRAIHSDNEWEEVPR